MNIFHKNGYKRVLLIVMVCHLLLLLVPFGPKIVNNIVEKAKAIQITLIMPSKNLTVVDVPNNDEALDSLPDEARYLSDRNQKVMEETTAPQQKIKSHLTLGDISQETLDISENGMNALKKPIGGKNVKDEISLTEDLSTGDFLENVQESDKTSINTIQFKYFSFYKRIKDQVESRWHSLLFKHVPGGLKMDRELETIVLIKVSKDGRIVGAKIEQDSGLPFLDKITIVTFDKVEYFHNPPKELFNDREHLYIQWGFKVRL